MPVEVKAWKCEKCGMTSLYKANVVRHEKTSCRKNQHCNVCRHFFEDDKGWWCCRECNKDHYVDHEHSCILIFEKTTCCPYWNAHDE